MEFLWQALRQVVFLLDQAVYGLIPSAYELIFYLSNINLATNEVFVAVINRIYLFLGIFMLFKVGFSIMQYIVDPNAFSDKSKGFGKLVTNSLVAVILLATVPWIFSAAYELQNKIILSNAIPRVILGDTTFEDYSDGNIDVNQAKAKQEEIHSMAVDVQFTIFSAFYNLNTTSNGGYTECDPSTTGKTNSNVIGSSDMVTTCWDAVEPALTEEIHKQGGTLKGIFKYCEDENCSSGVQDERDFATFKYLLWWMKDGGQSAFTISYIPIVSTIIGGYLLLLLVTFTIDIAVRVFKLMFLQAVAPIAIVSYIDPKESTSNGKLHNWVIESVKTYISLFIRLAVIYLAIQLIKLLTHTLFAPAANLITGTNNYEGIDSLYYNGMAPEGTLNVFVYIFLILGIFTFAKKVPQMIEGIFGIKMSGELQLNPFKSLNDNGLAAGIAGGVVGGLGGTWAGLTAAHENGTGYAKSIIAGGLSGTKFGVQNRGKNTILANSRNNAFKDITGNDMARLSFAQTIMGVGTGKQLERLSSANSANKATQRELMGRLSEASHVRNNAKDRLDKIQDSLRASGVDINSQNINSLKSSAEHNIASALSEHGGSVDELRNKLETARRRQQEIHERKTNGLLGVDYSAQERQLQAEVSKLENDMKTYNQYNDELTNYNNWISASDEYAKAVASETELRKAISEIEGDIKTISGEKSQIERMARKDEFPKDKVKKALENSAKRQNNN